MKKLRQFFTILFLFFAMFVKAATVDTLKTYSAAMNINIKATVIKPGSYNSKRQFPVLYLLHGAGGNYKDWITKVPNLKHLADLHEMIIVCPDGNATSWYFDSPIDPTFKYDTYISKELVDIIDVKYRTIRNRNGRAITGLSMGGHGAFFLAIKHQDTYGAVGSMSGGVDIKPFPEGWDLPKRLGTQKEHIENWKNNSVIDLIDLIQPKSLSITFECGTDDFFFAVNQHLHQELLYRRIPHDYTTRAGGHSWEYWENAIKYQTQFFEDFFTLAQQSN